MGSRRSKPQRTVRAEEREWSRIRDHFGVVLVLLIVTVFFSISAPNEQWAWLATTATLAATLTLAMLVSGAQKRVVRMGIALAASGLGVSTVIALTQEDARRYLSVTSLLLTLLAAGAIIRRVRLHAEINMLTILGAVCIYVLLGLSFAFIFECVGEFGSRPFFTAHEGRDAQRLHVFQLRHYGYRGLRRPLRPSGAVRPLLRRSTRGTAGPDRPCTSIDASGRRPGCLRSRTGWGRAQSQAPTGMRSPDSLPLVEDR